MEEFLLTDLSNMDQWPSFKAWRAWHSDLGHDSVRLRIRQDITARAAEIGATGVALQWNALLNQTQGPLIRTVLEGNVGMPGLLAWLGGFQLHLADEEVRVITWPPAPTGIHQPVLDGAPFFGLMRDTVQSRMRIEDGEEIRSGKLLMRAERLVTKVVILGPEQLKTIWNVNGVRVPSPTCG